MRIGLRLDVAALFAGHGFADANYRPGRLPYASVVGPLNLELEPERNPPRNSFIFARSPGYLIGADGMEANPVPGPGRLRVLLDGEAEMTLDLDFGADAAQPFDDDRARRVARTVSAAIAAAADGGAATIGGAPVADPARIAELRRSTLRWEPGRRRFFLVSGRSGGIDEAARLSTAGESSAALLPTANDIAQALGFGPAALAVPGRISRHRISQPTAVAVDIRLDLWAAGQQHLADMLERWAMLTPTRGRLLVDPGLLRANLADGASRIGLLQGAWPANKTSLALMDGADGFDNRVTDEPPRLTGAAALAGEALRLEDDGTATLGVWVAPALPPVDRPDHPAPSGYALTVEVSSEDAPIDGEAFRIATLTDVAGTVALSLTARTRNAGGATETILEARAGADGGGAFADRDFLLDPAVLAAGVTLHLVLDAASGSMGLWADGVALPLDGAVAPAAAAPGLPVGSDDMRLSFGDPDGADRPFRVRRAELLARPLGPMDPRLTATTASAARWRVGDPVGLARDPFLAETTEPFNAVVIGVEGDELVLDRPVPRPYTRATTIVFKRSLFFAQRQWRRRDDLMNRLFRLSAEYRVSAFLEDRLPTTTAQIVETPEVEVRDLSRVLTERAAADAGQEPPPPPAGPRRDRPGVHPEILDVPPASIGSADTDAAADTEPASAAGPQQ